MAMPGLAIIAKEEDDDSYLEAMHDWYTYAAYQHPMPGADDTLGMYDTTAKLWYRDEDYGYPLKYASNGSKVFWGRGDGWVFGAMARILSIMPSDAPHRAEYVSMLQNMASTLAANQKFNGFWAADVLDPADPIFPETSCTLFFAYGIAYGINAGYLDADTYTPYVGRAWNAITGTAIQTGDVLGWTQDIGKEPWNTWTASGQKNYGVGTLMLLGKELLEMVGSGA